jgi:hypothetical protein
MDVHEAVAAAERELRGTGATEGEVDPRWQAMIHVGEFIDEEPDAVWRFIGAWGAHPDADLRAAVATCLLEHLLEKHFVRFFPQVEGMVRGNPLFADTFRRCWKLGQSELPENSRLWDALMLDLGKLTG